MTPCTNAVYGFALNSAVKYDTPVARNRGGGRAQVSLAREGLPEAWEDAGDGANAALQRRLWLFKRVLPAKYRVRPAPRLMHTVRLPGESKGTEDAELHLCYVRAPIRREQGATASLSHLRR